MHKGSIAYEGEQEDMSEVKSVDAALFSVSGKFSSEVAEMDRIQKAQRQLEVLKIGIKDLEAGLDCIFKSLIKTRASLLNILTRCPNQPFVNSLIHLGHLCIKGFPNGFNF